MNNEELTNELLSTLDAINQTLQEMRSRYESTRASSTIPLDSFPSFYSLQDTRGRPMIADLLSAKANVLMALQSMHQGEEN